MAEDKAMAAQAGEKTATWREYFQRAAQESPRFPRARDSLDRDLCETLARWIPDDASVLDVECGQGERLGGLPHRVRVGVTSSSAGAETVRARYPGVEVHLGGLEALGPERRFDAIVADRICHSVPDIRRLLVELRERLNDGGRIYLVAYSYLWEWPARIAESLGLKLPAPASNWLSHSDLGNLFALADLEAVRFEDRMLLPGDVPGLSSWVNRYLGKLPGLQNLSLYRVYALRKRTVDGQRRHGSVSVVVPTRNEAGNVAAAIARTPVMGSGTELIFVEGGSTDNTWDTLQSAVRDYRGPLKLSAYRQSGQGKGDAVRLGFAKASGDILMILDADLTVQPEELPVFYDVLSRGLGDYVHGTRLVYPMQAKAMRTFNKLGNVAFSRLFTYLLQQPIKDTLCGTKVMWRRDYERLARARHLFGDFDPFGDFDLIFGAARLNLKIVEVPVRYQERVYGETNISRWKHGWMLLKMSAVAARKLRYV
jgi:SAM-dependent methyltransferase